uniref:Uncharacterized protein n=1 Tax=Nicotiana tabacum TaxID=4097 RepID=A0A1S3Y347_TOBAC|nr:PREDICTED: uncharacterized protein LOC107771651 [Nicotiana tabacum]
MDSATTIEIKVKYRTITTSHTKYVNTTITAQGLIESYSVRSITKSYQRSDSLKKTDTTLFPQIFAQQLLYFSKVSRCASSYSVHKFHASVSLSIYHRLLKFVFSSTVHNFIRKERLNDDLFNQYDLPQVIFEEEGEHEQVLDETNGPSWTTEDSQFMNNMREGIALQLVQGKGNA